MAGLRPASQENRKGVHPGCWRHNDVISFGTDKSSQPNHILPPLPLADTRKMCGVGRLLHGVQASFVRQPPWRVRKTISSPTALPRDPRQRAGPGSRAPAAPVLLAASCCGPCASRGHPALQVS